MNCLKGYIALKSCVSDTPESELYINSLPGINLEAMDKIADSDQVTYVKVFEDIEARALARISTDISARLRERYKLKNPSLSLNLGEKIIKNSDNIPINVIPKSANKLRGWIVDRTCDGKYVDSVFKKLYVQILPIYCTEEVAGVDVFVIDLYTGTELDKINLDAEIGWNYLRINKQYDSRKIFIGYDASKLDGVELSLQDLNSCSGYCDDWHHSEIMGAEINATNYNCVKGYNSFGLSGIFSINCTYDALVCNNKNLFKDALWYMLGVETMAEKIFSSRINRFTTTDRDKAKELMVYFDNRYIESIDSAVKSVNIDLSDACVECNQVVTIKETRM